jgi:hypothetical protein
MKFLEWFYCKHTSIFKSLYWEGSPSKYSPLSSCALCPTMLLLLKTFLELLLSNSLQCCYHISLDVFSILKSASLGGRLYFWKQPEVIWSQIRGKGRVFHFSNRFLGQKLLDREYFVSCSIVMVENPIIRPKFRPFLCIASHNCFNISI